MDYPCDMDVPHWGGNLFRCQWSRKRLTIDFSTPRDQAVFCSLSPCSKNGVIWWYALTTPDENAVQAWLMDLFPSFVFNRPHRRLMMSAADDVKLRMMAG